MFEVQLAILTSTELRADKDAHKYVAIAVIAAGYGGDMDVRYTECWWLCR